MSEVDINLEYEVLLATPEGQKYIAMLQMFEDKDSPYYHDDHWWNHNGRQAFIALAGIYYAPRKWEVDERTLDLIKYVYASRKLAV